MAREGALLYTFPVEGICKVIGNPKAKFKSFRVEHPNNYNLPKAPKLPYSKVEHRGDIIVVSNPPEYNGVNHASTVLVATETTGQEHVIVLKRYASHHIPKTHEEWVSRNARAIKGLKIHVVEPVVSNNILAHKFVQGTKVQGDELQELKGKFEDAKVEKLELQQGHFRKDENGRIHAILF